MAEWQPSSLDLAGSGELDNRAAEAHELHGPRCVVCPRGCKVDRRADVAGLCAVGRRAVVPSFFPHFGEEDCLRELAGLRDDLLLRLQPALCVATTTTCRGRCAASRLRRRGSRR